MILNQMKLSKFISIFCILIFLFSPHLFTFDVEFPIVQSFVHFPYSGNDLLKKGKYTISTDLLYSNVFMFDVPRSTFNDFELFSATFGFQYGISDRFNIEIFNRTSFLYGGFMDLFIMDFHELIGLKRGARENFERNVVNYYYTDKFNYRTAQLANYPLVLGLLASIYENERFGINFRTSLGIPLFG